MQPGNMGIAVLFQTVVTISCYLSNPGAYNEQKHRLQQLGLDTHYTLVGGSIFPAITNILGNCSVIERIDSSKEDFSVESYLPLHMSPPSTVQQDCSASLYLLRHQPVQLPRNNTKPGSRCMQEVLFYYVHHAVVFMLSLSFCWYEVRLDRSLS